MLEHIHKHHGTPSVVPREVQSGHVAMEETLTVTQKSRFIAIFVLLAVLRLAV